MASFGVRIGMSAGEIIAANINESVGGWGRTFLVETAEKAAICRNKGDARGPVRTLDEIRRREKH